MLNSHKRWLCDLLFDCFRVKKLDEPSSLEVIKLIALAKYTYKSLESPELVKELNEMKQLVLEAHDISIS
jgi:hypothetical protein